MANLRQEDQTLRYLDNPRLVTFLAQQHEECGAKVELAPGNLWLVFVIETADLETNALARSLLASAPFPYDSGLSEDDAWTLYYVEGASRPAAVHWLEDLAKQSAGEIRPVSAEHRRLIAQLATSPMPHRVAMELGQLHAREVLPAGCINEPKLMRALVDRWHMPGPLFLAAFRTLLFHQLVDLRVLLGELVSEDVEDLQRTLQRDSEHDPIGRSRHHASEEILKTLARFQVINWLELGHNDRITNPYAAYVDISRVGDEVLIPVDGVLTRVRAEHLLATVRVIRRRLYAGDNFETLDTMADWLPMELAPSFRFIRQRQFTRRDLTPMDRLYFLERALEGNEPSPRA